jgi:hypothetical protein
MDVLDEEILNLWKLLSENEVKYIMVGGFATNLHGFQRTTGDMDLWIKDSLENRKKLRKVFREIEIGDFESIETVDFIPGWSTIRLNSGFELDIMTSMKGIAQESFDECFEIAPTAMILEIPVKFLHINDLIRAKKASARPKDLIDVIELEKIRNEK